MPTGPEALARRATERLEALGDPRRASQMAAYMRTADPFAGVSSPDRKALLRELARDHAPGSLAEYQDQVSALWAIPYREGRYLAVDWACRFPAFIGPEALPLYERQVREGAWWDTVDAIAAHLVGRLLLEHRTRLRPVLEAWIHDPCLWIRRTALLAHLKHKGRTDEAQLFRHCLELAPETDFFIRKAIGWALREYAKTRPEAVRAFLASHRERLSTLSHREGMKHLG